MDIANYFQRNLVIFQIEKVQKLKQKYLYLNDYGIVEFPELILACSSLKTLHLHRNQIAELPSSLGNKLKSLKYLSLQFNDLHHFPQCLEHLSSLVSLNISHNPIGFLPECISNLENLNYLWCNCCGLTTIPKQIGNLKKLATFGARNNKIVTIPDTITNCEELCWLSLEGNQLNELPSFCNLKNLHHLNLNDNYFFQIPSSLCRIKTLNYLHLQNNRITSLNKKYIDKMAKVKINLLNNPIENAYEFIKHKNVMLSNKSLKQEGNNNQEEYSTDSSDLDTEWEHSSTDTLYINYDSSSSDYNSEQDNNELDVITAPKLTKFILQ
ncbi:hypothetical protein ABEB36_001453 [Hypothenemus hampei]|uniref:Leucine-rich repeat protein soc-2 homolog n=1 Tax=Hypothenemus hampei TaxID=57062 RepID=A0ABD1FEN5_HYPHA